jgi:hypothetical protein
MPVTLTPVQIESVREMVGDKSYSTVSSLITDLVEDAQRTAQIADVAEWDARKNKVLKMEGGSDGIKLDNDPLLRKLRNRTRARLDLPTVGSGLFYIPVGVGYHDACDY